MRTTIELDEETLTKLKMRAIERGDRGYSALVNEVLKEYFSRPDEAEKARRERQAAAIRALAGSISDETAERMYQSIAESRKNWREH